MYRGERNTVGIGQAHCEPGEKERVNTNINESVKQQSKGTPNHHGSRTDGPAFCKIFLHCDLNYQ